MVKKLFAGLLLSLLLSACADKSEQKQKSDEDWESLFNGKDLTGWSIKIKDHALNENYKNTFRIEDSMIRVSYDDYDKFDLQFGHLYTQKPYSYYKLKFEYRFHGNHLADAPEWGDRNSGVMLHSQSAESMGLHQDFPVSLEFQLLCGKGNDTVPTGNVCTPGTY